jgi:hypothetical protein
MSNGPRVSAAPWHPWRAALKRLFMDSEAGFGAAPSRWTRSCGSSTWEGISVSPGPHQQGKVTAMSGHIATTSDRYVEVLDAQFNPDAVPSSVNMITDLGLSQSCLTCRLTKATCSCITSPGEGKPDCQSLFGRLDWSEEIANPSPLGSQSDSRAKWVGKTGLYRSSGATAFVEWSSAVHSKTSEIGVSDAPTGRSDTRGRSVGAFSSVRRAGRLHITNGHAENRVSDIHQGLLGCRATNLSTFSTRVQARRVMSLQPPAAAFSDAERARSRSTRCCGPDREMPYPVLSGPHQQGLPPREKAGEPWVPGTDQGPMGFLGKGDAPGRRPQDVAVLPGGALQPAPSDPHQQGTPYGVPWQQTGAYGFLATRRDPLGPLARVS